MTFVRVSIVLLFAAIPCQAAGSDAPSAGSKPPSMLSGPYLTPPAAPTSGEMVVDAADLVPPVLHPDPSLSPPSTAPAPAPPPPSDSSPATKSVTVNLIQLMVKRGLISRADAAGLVHQAEQEASTAQHQDVAAAPEPVKGGHDAEGMLRSPPSAPAGGGGGDDSVAVTYVPDVVKNQIRDEVTADVMTQARQAGLATRNDIPDWVHRFRITGDVRTRYEADDFPDGNATGEIVNYNAINTGSGFDVNGLTARSGLLPTYNVDQDRNRFRLRARFGAEVDLGKGFTAGLRLGTGSDNSPVTENQTLGGVNGFTDNQGGNFSKYQIWLDRAFLRYEWGGVPERDFSVSLGRFDNPFFSTSMIWADDLAFDGIAFMGKVKVVDGVTPFLTVGAFPVFNTDLNFGTNSTVAGNGYDSEDKYLIAAQAGTNWTISKDLSFKGAAAYYDFENTQGEVSSPISQDEFAALGTNFNGDTDDSRPSFAQHGNTYIALRNVVLDPALTTPTPVYEYYGLASAFHEVALTGQLDYNHFDPFHLSVIGEFVDNIAFNKGEIEGEGPAILPGPQNNNNGSTFAGGGMGYDVRATAGSVALQKLWDWNINVAYRYLESDAVIDAFNDADFGGYINGTNLHGYIIGANLALAPRVWTSFRFMSADSIAGPPLHADTFQLDINAKF